jgi:hypothetical protein
MRERHWADCWAYGTLHLHPNIQDNVTATDQLSLDVHRCQKLVDLYKVLHHPRGMTVRKNSTELVSNKFLQFSHCQVLKFRISRTAELIKFDF